jgi:hypothetical protein
VKRAARLAALLLVVAAAARAQEAGARGGAVRGLVRSTQDEPIAYAVVAFTPGFGRRFTDEAGAFALANVPPGTYRLVVRQVGFVPFDTTIVKIANTPLALTIRLERLAVELSQITVVASRHCTNPGLPDSAVSPELASIFGQLRLNAERYAFLADSYPYRYRISRTFTDYDYADQVLTVTTDTVQYQSNARARYNPGDVVATGLGPARTTARILKLPMLSDFADSTFLVNHCFAYAGASQRGEDRIVRFEFRPADTLRMADIEGDVELDARSYQVRRATITLTRAGRAMPGLLSAADTITFAELFPNIVVPRRVEGTLVPAPEYGVRRRVGRSTEVQTLLDVHFVRALPAARPALPL